MPIDMRRVLLAAIQAALEEPSPAPPRPKSRRPKGRALVLGAGLMTAGRLVARSRGHEIVEVVQRHLDDAREFVLGDHVDAEADEEFDDDDYYEDEFDDDYDPDEPEGEAQDPDDLEREEDEADASPQTEDVPSPRSRGRARVS